MSMTWLADVDKETFWAHHAWPEFGASVIDSHAVAILPIFGFADHGLGLPLDAEEVLGSFVLKRAVSIAESTFRVLPPVRFALAPYPSNFFGIDPETFHDFILEIADGVKRAGFQKLVFFTTSPWNAEIVEAVSRDVRVDLRLQTFVLPLAGFGLNFHPAGEDRGKTQAAVAKILGETPRPGRRPAKTSDLDFRPGNFPWPASLLPGPPLDGLASAAKAGDRIAVTLREIALRPGIAGEDTTVPAAPKIASPQVDDSPPFPHGFRPRYLAAMQVEDWEQIREKASAWVIVPTAAIEQHGPHLPVGVDAMLGHAWVTQTLNNFPSGARIFVAPPITYGKSNEHVGFPGTLSISAKTLRRIVLAIATQLKAIGFRQIAILNSHGGNTAVLAYTAREIQTTLGLRAGILGQPYRPDLSDQETELGFHAGEWETSLMLAIASDLVRMDHAVSEYPAQREDLHDVRLDHGPANLSWITADISETGVMGDAKSSTLEKGKRWLEGGASALAQKLGSLDKS